jgi:hypothetical protein
MNASQVLTALKLALAVIVMATIGASQAHALDSKIYPGLMCVYYNGGGSLGYEYGSIGNYSTTGKLGVGCPILRDAASMNSGWVQVLDRNSAEDVECRVIAAYRSGNVISASFSGWQRSASVGGTQLSFGSLGATSLSHYYYFCNLPPMTTSGASQVVTYRVTENDN